MSDAYRPITTAQKLSLPLNGTIYTTTRTVADEKALPIIGSTMSAELGSAFSTSIVIEATEIPDGTMKRQTIVHAIIPSEADQLESNWEFATCDIGGRKFNGITRTVIYPKSSFNKSSPALGSAMLISAAVGGVNGSDYTFTNEGYILVSRNASRAGMQLEPYFKVEVQEYVKRVVMVSVGVDQINGKPLRETTTLYHAGETVTGANVSAATLFSDAQANNSFWGVQSTGYENSGQMLSAEWYAITSSQVIAGTYNAGTPPYVSVSDFTTNDDYYWPPVLQYIEFMDWEKREGGADIFPRVVFKREEYRGPCATRTVRTWASTPFTIPVVSQMLPNGGHYGSPFFPLNIPNCLHGVIAATCDIGNADPEYIQNVGSTRVFLATVPTDWAASITAYDDQEPYRGGYLRTVKTVFAPSFGVSSGGAPVVVVPPPADLAASKLTGSGFDLTWTADATATKYIVEVATDTAFTNYVWHSTEATNSVTISGLLPATTYYCRVSTIRGGYMVSEPCPYITAPIPAP